jgi:hypothetical protein
MKRYTLLGLTGMLLLGLASASASAETMTKPAAGVTKVVFKVVGEVLIRPGNEEKMVVEAEPKVLAQLDISTKGDTMTLASKGSIKTDKGIKFTLTIKSFHSFMHDGSGNVRIENFSGNDMEALAKGSGDIVLSNIKPGKLTLAIPGSGNIEASGSGKMLLAKIDGSGTIEAVKFKAQSADVRIDGSGNIRVHADESLKASISGSGNIEYEGKAKVTKSITGAGNIEPI